MKLSCDTCRFWNQLKFGEVSAFEDGNYTVDDYGTGECRFNPPIGIRNPEAMALGANSMDAAQNAHWPVTWDQHWCGQHKLRLAVIDGGAA
ncbi:hypothetical protein K9B33_17815 [Sphingobium sp. 3R8]|uniref:hypothetical protein n=1 Tax=Sphingobium sp. 3R8 TaxID=2874921 RepID=UPI001CCE0F79|nr:hypothetical protein [Sphingobium sp. 3R8]MBA4091405.1 hypothetical protein [Sphingobium sp.]MBZ9649395.1 hypothetical protein [Sphingobium sp. 3R8]